MDFREELHTIRDRGLYRRMRAVVGTSGGRCIVEGNEALLLCSNNYLGLSDHPSLKEAAAKAVQSHGTSSGASRLVSGTMELHEMLEKEIARFKGTESALLFNSGYAANTGVIPALVGRGDVILSDRLNHASIVDGCLLSRARLVRYPHNDINLLRLLLLREAASGRRVLVVTDGVFSMDGDVARLRELVAVKKEFDALLMVDDAHGTGVFGAGGKGTAEDAGVMSQVDIHMGTFGKALGSFGAYIAASSEIIDLLVNRARSLVFSTSLPPSVTAASLAALRLVTSEEGQILRKRLKENTERFRTALAGAGFDTMGSSTQIVPLQVGGAEAALEFSRLLLEKGVFVQAIRPPTVPAGTSRLRFTLMATHEKADLDMAVSALVLVGTELGVLS